MATQKVSFQGADGAQLSGLIDAPDGKVEHWAMFAHCFTCSKTSLAASRIAKALAGRGIGVLRFDFTGLGESDGDFSETGFSTNVADLKAASEWMATNGRPISLLIGHSLGGAASVVAGAALPSVKAVATIGAPSDADHVIAQFKQDVPEIEAKGQAEVNLGGRPFTLTKAFLEDVRGASVREAAAGLAKPLLIMHSPIDATVGIDNATGLFIAAKHPKSFVSLDKADHLLTSRTDAESVVDVIAGWVARYLDLSPKVETAAIARHPDEPVMVRETGLSGPYQNIVQTGPHTFFADEPATIGGSDSGPDPYALVSAGLGACTSITLRMYANRKKWPLERVEIRIHHGKAHPDDCEDCGPGDKIDVFEREIELAGPLDEEQRQRLLEIADRCPVHRTLEAEAVVRTRLVTVSA